MLFGLSYLQMGVGSLTVKTMGDMEMIDATGMRATFTDEGVVLDVVPMAECCEMCNDPRLMTVDGIKKCVACGCINHIELNHHG
jgi:hypothetical protein